MPLFPRPRLTPPIVPFLAETNTYRDQITAAGASISQDTLQAIDRFIRDCYTAGIWSKLTEVAPLAGNNLTAAIQKLKYKGGGLASMVSNNFVQADFNERGSNGGLAGDGATKYLDFRYDISQFTSLNCHQSVWLREDEVVATKYWFASTSASDNFSLGTSNGSNQQACIGGVSGAAVNAASPTRGWYYQDRTGATAHQLCKDNVQVATDSFSWNSGMASQPLYVCARYNSGSPGSYSAKRISFLTIGQALTVAERTALYNAILTFNNHLGR